MSCVDSARIFITLHGSQRMTQRQIPFDDVREVARNHSVAYTQPDGRLVRVGSVASGQRLQVIFEMNALGWDVVTAYYRL